MYSDKNIRIMAIASAVFYAAVTAGVGFLLLDGIVAATAYGMAVIGGAIAYIAVQRILKNVQQDE